MVSLVSQKSHQRSGIIYHHGDNSIDCGKKEYKRVAEYYSQIGPRVVHLYVPNSILPPESLNNQQREELSQTLAAGFVNVNGATTNNHYAHSLLVNNEGYVRVIQHELEYPPRQAGLTSEQRPKVAGIKSEKNFRCTSLEDYMQTLRAIVKDLLIEQGQPELLELSHEQRLQVRTTSQSSVAAKRKYISKRRNVKFNPYMLLHLILRSPINSSVAGMIERNFNAIYFVNELKKLASSSSEKYPGYLRLIAAQLKQRGVPDEIVNTYIQALKDIVRHMKR